MTEDIRDPHSGDGGDNDMPVALRPETPPDNLVTHARFTGRKETDPAPAPIDLEALRKAGLVGDDLASLDDLGLAEPQYGEEVIGRLTEDEAALYVAFHTAHKDYKAIENELGGDFLIKAGQRVKAGRGDEPPDMADIVTEAEAVPFFRAQRRAETLRSNLYWQISERVGHHDWVLSVRSKGRIVRLNRKW